MPSFPFDPLADFTPTPAYRRSIITGIIDSYNSNYDFLLEAVQNAVDALEDAKLGELPGPYILAITVNLKDNWISVLDTGVGLDESQLVQAVAPHVTFKGDPGITAKRGTRHAYRGFKGVGLTFLAYGADDARFHSKKDGKTLKIKMLFGRSWAFGTRNEPANLDVDDSPTPLDLYDRGTYVRIQFSGTTRPKSLRGLAPTPEAWQVIVRTRTAAGQILLAREPVLDIQVKLTVVTADGGEHTSTLPSNFYFPSDVERVSPPFRFLDLNEFFAQQGEIASAPPEKRRQDGLFLVWDTDRIKKELSDSEQKEFETELEAYTPNVYGFVPYQGSVWGEINEILTGQKNRNHLYPGLLIGVNRQRLADVFEIEATRFETFSRNICVVVHFDNAKPDQGRKTVQEEVLSLAKATGNRVVQYLARQRALLRPAGESSTPQQRQIERNHQDWDFNVKIHARDNPLQIPPATYVSPPLTEQDVIGLFSQFAALGLFPGLQTFATSQTKTYDSLIRFECEIETLGLGYSFEKYPLGLDPSVIGDRSPFQTRSLTVEFKNNLDGIIFDVDDPNSPKQFSHIDVCICWGSIGERFPRL